MTKPIKIILFLFIISLPLFADNNLKASSPLFPIFQDGKYGYIDKTGKIVINPQFTDSSSFSEGLAKVRIGKKYGYIDRTGKLVINSRFVWASDFSEGLAAVLKGGKFGYIDIAGGIVIEPLFDDAKDFSEGLAIV